ncbi:MAG: hypothetical protein WCR72_01775 [Bacteroidota bacterium]
MEAINMRFREGAWRGVGDKEKTGWYAESLFVFDGITYHPALPENTFVVHNSADNKVYTVLFTDGTNVQVSTPVITLASGETFDRFSHLGNVLLVFTDLKKYILYYVNGIYKNITALPMPHFGVVSTPTADVFPDGKFIDTFSFLNSSALTGSDLDDYAKGLVLGNYYLKISDYQILNYITGIFGLRIAFRLFDGTYINHSLPIFQSLGSDLGSALVYYVYDSTHDTYTAGMRNVNVFKNFLKYDFFGCGEFNLQQYYDAGIVESMDIFCTRPVNPRNLTGKSIVWAKTVTHPETYLTLTSLVPPLDKFEDAMLSENYYKLYSIPISDLIVSANNKGMYGRIELDFTKEVSANELLPPDNFSHHEITSNADYQYNSRLHLSNITTTLSNPLDNSLPLILSKNTGGTGLEWINEEDYGVLGTVLSGVTIRQRVYLKTSDNKIKIVDSELSKNFPSLDIDEVSILTGFMPDSYNYLVFGPGPYYVGLRNIISYPDYRAFKIRYYYTYLGVKYTIGLFDLKPSASLNVSYYGTIPEVGSSADIIHLPIPTVLTSGTVFSDTDVIDNISIDTNRMQVSGIFNPLVWPALNSYRFGMIHNEVIAMCAVEQALSDQVFGLYPLYIFTKQGVFSIQHGNGEVLYSTSQPLNNDILIGRTAVNNITGGIAYATREGVRILSGSQGELISLPVSGSIFNPIAGESEFISALDELNSQLPTIFDYLSLYITFLEYISDGCTILYDVYNTEIIVTNANYSYSYTFNLETKSWATRTESFTDVLVISGRQAGVKRSSALDGDALVYTTTLHYIDQEETADSVECKYLMFQTRPLNLSSSNVKRIDKLVLRALYENPADEYSIFQVYGSNDLATWNIITYQQCMVGGDVHTTRLLGNYKYFIVVFACARLGATINQMDVIYAERFAKLLS